MGRVQEFGSLRHLVVRFFGALWPGGPSPSDEQWARQWLLPGEQELWGRMSGPDRRHAVGVARGTIELLEPTGQVASRPVVASALLHDVGKVESGFGTIGRALLTGVALFVGRQRLVAPPVGTEGATRRRVRLYFSHDQVGAAMLAEAGSDPVTVAWTSEHHLDPSRWTLEPVVAHALKDADGD